MRKCFQSLSTIWINYILYCTIYANKYNNYVKLWDSNTYWPQFAGHQFCWFSKRPVRRWCECVGRPNQWVFLFCIIASFPTFKTHDTIVQNHCWRCWKKLMESDTSKSSGADGIPNWITLLSEREFIKKHPVWLTPHISTKPWGLTITNMKASKGYLQRMHWCIWYTTVFIFQRMQRVKLNLVVSSWVSLSRAVPQGSWIVHLCFIVFVSDIMVDGKLKMHGNWARRCAMRWLMKIHAWSWPATSGHGWL